MDWVWANRAELGSLALTHAWLSAVPLVVGLVVSVPVGWWVSRSRRASVLARRVSSLVLAGGNVLYTIPSLALFVILPSVLGTGFLSPWNVVVALSLYAIALLVGTSANAFTSVSDVVLDAATASGYSAAGRGLRVELPLAGPVLLAGLRVASVSTVSLVSVGALIGVSNLGSLFTDGFRRDFTTEIVVGVVGTVLLALAFDLILVLAGRVLMPWSAGARS
jgi:osmoprotectant transport system permease protein